MQNLSDSWIVRRLTEGFDGAVVVIIGATGGIGTEVARQAGQLGARLVCASRSGRRPEIAEPVAACHALDVRDTASIRAFAGAIEREFGRIDVLVNTAGVSWQLPPNDLSALTDEIIDEVLASNARAPLVLTRELAPLLKQGHDPVLVQVSSIAAVTGGGSNVAYAAAKAGLDTMARAFARALAPAGRVVNVSPSALETPFARGRGEEFVASTTRQSALKRLASLEEVAAAILCAARVLTATTGTVINVDAGRAL